MHIKLFTSTILITFYYRTINIDHLINIFKLERILEITFLLIVDIFLSSNESSLLILPDLLLIII